MNKAQRIHNQAGKALRDAVAKVVKERRISGKPLSIWKNGKVVSVSASAVKVK